MIALAATMLVAGVALAGPNGPGKEDTGDPDIPNVTLKRADVQASSGVAAGVGARVESRAVGGEVQDRWIALFRAYLRLVRAVGL